MSTLIELNEGVFCFPVANEAHLIASERLFCVSIRTLVLHIRDVATTEAESTLYIPLKQGTTTTPTPTPTRRQLLQSRSINRPPPAKQTKMTRHGEDDAPAVVWNKMAAAQDMKRSAVPCPQPLGTVFTAYLHRAYRGHNALPVSLSFVQTLTSQMYPRAFQRHVVSVRGRSWKSFVTAHVGLVVLCGCGLENEKDVHCILGPWPWPRMSTESMAVGGEEDMDTLAYATLRQLREQARMAKAGVPTNTSTSDSLHLRETISRAVCAMRDDLTRANADWSVMVRVVQYYMDIHVLITSCNALISDLLRRTITEDDAHGWGALPIIPALLGAFAEDHENGQDEDDEDASRDGGVSSVAAIEARRRELLSSKNVCRSVQWELASHLKTRHAIYRHVSTACLLSKIHGCVVHTLHVGSLDPSWTNCLFYPWCHSLRHFVSTHQVTYPGLRSFCKARCDRGRDGKGGA